MKERYIYTFPNGSLDQSGFTPSYILEHGFTYGKIGRKAFSFKKLDSIEEFLLLPNNLALVLDTNYMLKDPILEKFFDLVTQKHLKKERSSTNLQAYGNDLAHSDIKRHIAIPPFACKGFLSKEKDFDLEKALGVYARDCSSKLLPESARTYFGTVDKRGFYAPLHRRSLSHR